MTAFRQGLAAAKAAISFDELQLPLAERRQLCFDLLAEFGARNISEGKNCEIYHSCCLPFGGHPRGDQKPSARLNYEKLMYKCWGCGGGGLLWFVATMRGEEECARTVEWLRARSGAGGVQEIDRLVSFLDSLAAELHRVPEAHQIPRYDERVLEPWMFIHPYLTEFRRVRQENIIERRVGYGVINVNMGDNVFKPSHRIVVPHFWRGDLVGWQSRRIVDDGTPKWLSTPMLPKDTTLYNYDADRDAVIVEAPMSSVTRAHQAHLEAAFGAALTEHQMDLVAAHKGRIVLWFDNDPAGWKATEDVGTYIMARNANVWAIDNPYAADPADLDDGTFARIMSERCVPFVLWGRPRALEEWRRPDGHQEVRSGAGAEG